jgi:hypothetical protein
MSSLHDEAGMEAKKFSPDFEKFKALLLYVCAKTEKERGFGATKLNKILYFSDFRSFQRTGKPITGETYVKRQFGPAPKRLLIAQKELVKERKLLTRDVPSYSDKRREFIVLELPDVTKHFTAEEISLVDEMIDTITHHFSAAEISDVTHDDIWSILELGDEIPYEAVYASQVGEIDETDVEWIREQGIA